MITSGRPTLSELIFLRIPHRVSPHYRVFGNLLLNDDTGAIVQTVVESQMTGESLPYGGVKQIAMWILVRWLQISEDATWNYLMRVLRACQLDALAAEIEAKITGIYYIYCYSKI